MHASVEGYTIEREIEPEHPRCTTSDPVFAATNARGERVALKLLYLYFPLRPESTARYIEALHQARAIVSPHVMRVVDHGFASDGAPYYAMSFVEGESVASVIDRGVVATHDQVRLLLGQIASAATAASTAGCAPHLHTRHIMLCADGVKLWNFGVWPWRHWAHDLVAGRYTNGGQVTWHPNVTPREAKGLPSDAQNAAAQLALIAYSMLTARHYWHADNDPDASPMDMLTEIMRGPGEPPSARTQVALPAGFDAWFARCLDGAVPDAATAAADFPA
jgi:hypothetical protein